MTNHQNYKIGLINDDEKIQFHVSDPWYLAIIYNIQDEIEVVMLFICTSIAVTGGFLTDIGLIDTPAVLGQTERNPLDKYAKLRVMSATVGQAVGGFLATLLLVAVAFFVL